MLQHLEVRSAVNSRLKEAADAFPNHRRGRMLDRGLCARWPVPFTRFAPPLEGAGHQKFKKNLDSPHQVTLAAADANTPLRQICGA